MSKDDRYEMQPYSSSSSVLSSQYSHAQAHSLRRSYYPLSKLPSKARSEIDKLLWRKNKSQSSPYRWSLISVCYDLQSSRKNSKTLLKRIFSSSDAQPKGKPPYLVILRGKSLSKAEWEERRHNPLSSLDTLELPPPEYQSSYSESDTDSISSFDSYTDSNSSYFTDDEYVTDSEDDEYVVDMVQRRDYEGKIRNREWKQIIARDYEKQDCYDWQRRGYGCRPKIGRGKPKARESWYKPDDYDDGFDDCDYGGREEDGYWYARRVAEARRQNRGIWQRETDLMLAGAANLDILEL